VALIADEASREVAASIAAALDRIGVDWEGVLIEQVAVRPLTAAPRPVLDALERADAGILCVQPRQGELVARMAIVSVVERRGIRYAHMVGVTPEIMRQGMRADYRLVDELSQRLCERMRQARDLRVQTPSGTSFTATFDPTLAWVKTSGLINPRYWSNLPAARCSRRRRAWTAFSSATGPPATTSAEYGDLRATPLTLEIAGGRLQTARCQRADSNANSGTTATPTIRATASASWRSAPTSPSKT
jgi:hypothetical protein